MVFQPANGCCTPQSLVKVLVFVVYRLTMPCQSLLVGGAHNFSPFLINQLLVYCLIYSLVFINFPPFASKLGKREKKYEKQDSTSKPGTWHSFAGPNIQCAKSRLNGQCSVTEGKEKGLILGHTCVM